MDSLDNFRERFEALEQQTKAMGAHTSTVARRRRWWPITGSVAAMAVLGLALALPLPVLAKTFFTFTTIDIPFSGAFQTTPTGINDKGQIAGFYLTSGLASHGFLLSDGNFSTFDFTTANCCTDFHGINNQGQVVGYGGTVSFLFTGGQFSIISVPGSTFTSANGINNTGQIVGDTIVSNQAIGFLLHGGSFSFISNSTSALGINDPGQIVGTVGAHGYLLTDNVLSTVDFPGAQNTIPTGINNTGAIVGLYVALPQILHGFILDQQGFSTIDFPGSTSTQVLGINNQGQIVGLYFDSSGGHGFLATPASDTTPPVITVSANPMTLWPPNGQMVPVTVSGMMTDHEPGGTGVNPSTAAYAVTDEYGQMQPSGSVPLGSDSSYSFVSQLQASRHGNDTDGRQYIITVTAQDNAGNTRSAATGVTVPHDQGK